MRLWTLSNIEIIYIITLNIKDCDSTMWHFPLQDLSAANKPSSAPQPKQCTTSSAAASRASVPPLASSCKRIFSPFYTSGNMWNIFCFCWPLYRIKLVKNESVDSDSMSRLATIRDSSRLESDDSIVIWVSRSDSSRLTQVGLPSLVLVNFVALFHVMSKIL